MFEQARERVDAGASLTATGEDSLLLLLISTKHDGGGE